MMQDSELKNRLRRFLLWMGLVCIVLLAILSVFGAFLGADLAQRFFNSIPVSIYWIAFTALLLAAIASFHRLLCIRGLFLIHLGCILVLLGVYGAHRRDSKHATPYSKPTQYAQAKWSSTGAKPKTWLYLRLMKKKHSPLR